MDLEALVLDHGGVLDDPGNGDGAEPPVLAAARWLRARGIRTALVSNADSVAEAASDAFDAVLLSGDLGIAKPDPAIYRLAADRLGVDPSRCVFVDDLRTNVDGAVATGMVGIHHRDVAATRYELEVLFDLELPL
ncbi:HAD-IA family hydrolase [Saccharopolyspora rosea]|uniref:HAD-IA family hydrolase n=1 Tax=Saccharopolyspora rosea TaxID=524884 RepID=A0ABW3G420_9PSEU|nr:HAD-IA family hydrolase [Saccharopolyspora rosea]